MALLILGSQKDAASILVRFQSRSRCANNIVETVAKCGWWENSSYLFLSSPGLGLPRQSPDGRFRSDQLRYSDGDRGRRDGAPRGFPRFPVSARMSAAAR